MEAYSNYYIKDKNEPNKSLIVTDENPKGVTITIKSGEGQEQFSLPRVQMVEALEYILAKIKSD